MHVNRGGQSRQDLLAGYSRASYMGIVFAALVTGLSLAFWVFTLLRSKNAGEVGGRETGIARIEISRGSAASPNHERTISTENQSSVTK